MESALTFGSLGDIVALCQLVGELSRALSDSRGSGRDYRDLRQDLDTFVRILMLVVGTCHQQRESSAELNSLNTMTKAIVEECAALMRQELDRIHVKYDRHLRQGGSGNVVKDAYRKVEWSVGEQESMTKLREKLQANTQRLGLLAGHAARESARVDKAAIIQRLRGLDGQGARQQEQQRDVADAQQRLIKLNENQSQHLSMISKWIASQEETNRTKVSSHRPQSKIGRTLDPTRNMPVWFEDALGNLCEMPMDWMFHTLLAHRFEKLRGHRMVLLHQYALEENCTGKSLDRTRPWSENFRRGMKVNMSMVFIYAKTTASCPRCKTSVEAPKDVSVECQVEGCGMWFRIVDGAEETEFLTRTLTTKKSASRNNNGSSNTIAVDEPADFQRVRLVHIPGMSPSPPPPVTPTFGFAANVAMYFISPQRLAWTAVYVEGQRLSRRRPAV